MSSADNKQDNALRRYIGALEQWPDDAPPSPEELRKIQTSIRLTPDDREKLNTLADNHIRRARGALDDGAFDQAIAELARAAQLRPLDFRIRVELAESHLQRSLERGYGRNDRKKAVRLAHTALRLSPNNAEARGFLQEYHRMNSDFRMVRSRRILLPLTALTLLLAAMAWWQRDWIMEFIQPQSSATGVASAVVALPDETGFRDVAVDVGSLADGKLDVELVSATIGRKNDASYFRLSGRMRPKIDSLGTLTLLIRGRDSAGLSLFTIPWVVRDENDPVLVPGDTAVLLTHRWLAESEAAVNSMELNLWEGEWIPDEPRRISGDTQLFWDVPAPEGVSLFVQVREMRLQEAYDRQVLHMDLAVENRGLVDVAGLVVGVSMGPQWPESVLEPLGVGEPALSGGERRVWKITMNFPLDADPVSHPVTVRIKDAHLNRPL